MAKFDLKFKAIDDNNHTIQTFVNSDLKDVVIAQVSKNGMMTIVLDKSTAIKFAKTLRTEINKIKESEVDNG
jgi:hypothetical protein